MMSNNNDYENMNRIRHENMSNLWDALKDISNRYGEYELLSERTLTHLSKSVPDAVNERAILEKAFELDIPEKLAVFFASQQNQMAMYLTALAIQLGGEPFSGDESLRWSCLYGLLRAMGWGGYLKKRHYSPDETTLREGLRNHKECLTDDMIDQAVDDYSWDN